MALWNLEPKSSSCRAKLPLKLADFPGICTGEGLADGSLKWSPWRFFIVSSTMRGRDCESIAKQQLFETKQVESFPVLPQSMKLSHTHLTENTYVYVRDHANKILVSPTFFFNTCIIERQHGTMSHGLKIIFVFKPDSSFSRTELKQNQTCNKWSIVRNG